MNTLCERHNFTSWHHNQNMKYKHDNIFIRFTKTAQQQTSNKSRLDSESVNGNTITTDKNHAHGRLEPLLLTAATHKIKPTLAENRVSKNQTVVCTSGIESSLTKLWTFSPVLTPVNVQKKFQYLAPWKAADLSSTVLHVHFDEQVF